MRMVILTPEVLKGNAVCRTAITTIGREPDGYDAERGDFLWFFEDPNEASVYLGAVKDATSKEHGAVWRLDRPPSLWFGEVSNPDVAFCTYTKWAYVNDVKVPSLIFSASEVCLPIHESKILYTHKE